MYRIKIKKRKYRKHDALCLFNEKGEIAAVVIEKEPTRHDLLQLQNKTGLRIEWEAIWDRFQRGVFGRYCKVCGQYFETKAQTQKFCSEECRKESKKRRQKEYYEDNRLEILKKVTNKRRFRQRQKYEIIREHIVNIGYMPQGFNQIDDRPHDLGEGRLRQRPNPDFEKEQKLVEKELKRLLKR